jgi:methylenetetrahydrofolate dehydrogenase (NADP+) / methenyltetrahydrofolate cyclohydrolase
MPKKLLSGSDIVEYIKPRQIAAVRTLKAKGITPKLAIVRTNSEPVIDLYLRIKQSYATDICAEVEIINCDSKSAAQEVQKLNSRPDIHGIIIQLPLGDPLYTNDLLNSVDPAKDVDGLGDKSACDPATPTAIIWLLAGYNIELKDKNILVVGQGRLVGAPLTKMLLASGCSVTGVDDSVKDLAGVCKTSDVVITATGVPGLITSEMLCDGAVVVDAGTATENGVVVGDIAEDARLRPDIMITPNKGGVGPLTVAALFDNLLIACQKL